MSYPEWKFYPARTRPPAWVTPLIGAFAAAQMEIDSDLAGIKPLSYDLARFRRAGAESAALGPACNAVRRIVKKLGPHS
jgi:hypothetical protein